MADEVISRAAGISLILAIGFLGGCKKCHVGTVQATPLEYVAFAGQSNVIGGNGLSTSFVESVGSAGRAISPLQCAVGGTYIDQWQKGEALYIACLSQMQEHPPKALIWWQGEADAHDQALSDAWSTKFERMIGDFRHDLGYQIPVIYVVLANGDNNEKWATVQNAQRGIHLEGVYATDIRFAEQYRKPFDVHYSTMGYHVIGQAIADQYLEFVR